MKTVIVIGDEIANLSLDEFDERTSLGAANPPNTNFIASEGVRDPVAPSMATDSSMAILAMLGYNLSKRYTDGEHWKLRGVGKLCVFW